MDNPEKPIRFDVDNRGGEFVNRDKHVHGDEVHQDKAMRDKYEVHPGGVLVAGSEVIRLPTGEELRAYLQTVRDFYARWADQPDEPDPPLAEQATSPDSGPDAFIPLRALPMRVARFIAQPGGQPAPAQDLLPALQNTRRAIILGEPGSGKSTALERIAWATASDALDQPAGAPLLVPVFVPLSGYRGEPDLLTVVSQSLKARGLRLDNLASLRAWLQTDGIRVAWLLDGLNELRLDHRQDGWDAIRSHAIDFPAHTIYLTCRTADFDAAAQAEPALQVLPEAQLWTVEPLLDDIRYWHDPEGHSDVRDYLRLYLGHADGKRLYDRISADARLRDLARLPLFLWMLKESGSGGGELPVDRGGLVQRFIRSARIWSRTALTLRTQAERGLELLGWRMQQAGSLEIDGGDLDAVLETTGRRGNVDALCAALQSTGLLIDLHSGSYRLLHQLMQEYAAAAHLVRQADCGAQLATLAQGEAWRETCIMALWLRNDLHTAEYLQGLMAEPAVDLRVRIAAATVLAEVGDPRFQRRPYAVARADNTGQVTEQTVYAIEPEMIAIPAGRALLGGEDPDADSDELPQSRVQIAAFELAVYPVTNAEYACFMEDQGYEQTDLWTPAGQAWLRGESKLDPDTEKDLREYHRWLRGGLENILADWKQSRSLSEEQAANLRGIATQWSEDDYVEAYNRQILAEQRREPFWWRDSRFNAVTQPVVGVNWYEAMAYAAWLSRVTGALYRLPTEAEWEWAARRNARRYPWGDDWDPARCNSSDSRLGQTSPVGVFPHGATPDGLHDLAGNVYEWTATLYKPYRYDPGDGREDPLVEGLRVMRGGSWYVGRTNVRCAYRDGFSPRNRDNFLGYRLARAYS